MRRSIVAVPAALLLSLVVAGTALGAFCGVDSKPSGAGQLIVLWVDIPSGVQTIVSGANAAGKFTGGFADVYLDFDGDGTADCFIDDTFLISEHSGSVAPGQDFFGLPVNPGVSNGFDRGVDPGGAHGVGEAELTGDC
jgi:hypothetical protein